MVPPATYMQANGWLSCEQRGGLILRVELLIKIIFIYIYISVLLINIFRSRQEYYEFPHLPTYSVDSPLTNCIYPTPTIYPTTISNRNTSLHVYNRANPNKTETNPIFLSYRGGLVFPLFCVHDE